MNNTIFESWLKLVNEAMRGGGDAQRTIQAMTGSAMAPDEMLRTMTRFMPAGIMPASTEVLTDSMEQVWKTMGVVPRYRYLELLERNDDLQRRLKEAEKTNEQIKGVMGGMGAQPEEARRAVDMWNNALNETMKAQLEWMRTFSTASAEAVTKAGGSEDSASRSSDVANGQSQGNPAKKNS